jgi:hypothetical protein
VSHVTTTPVTDVTSLAVTNDTRRCDDRHLASVTERTKIRVSSERPSGGRRRSGVMAEKKISPKAPEKTESQSSKVAAARVSKKQMAKKQMAKKQAAR